MRHMNPLRIIATKVPESGSTACAATLPRPQTRTRSYETTCEGPMETGSDASHLGPNRGRAAVGGSGRDKEWQVDPSRLLLDNPLRYLFLNTMVFRRRSGTPEWREGTQGATRHTNFERPRAARPGRGRPEHAGQRTKPSLCSPGPSRWNKRRRPHTTPTCPCSAAPGVGKSSQLPGRFRHEGQHC